tara:strand:- start:73 stop:486 length:414 start_codon:yes stop_codon:yes gene_type:complete
MANDLKTPTDIEKIYSVLESGISENKSIKTYALPNARQWLGSRYFALWVLPIYIIKKFRALADSSAFVKPYSPSRSGMTYKQPETLFTSLRMVFQGKDHLSFFDHRFIGIWILPFAATGIIFELLFIAPTKNIPPFS